MYQIIQNKSISEIWRKNRELNREELNDKTIDKDKLYNKIISHALENAKEYDGLIIILPKTKLKDEMNFEFDLLKSAKSVYKMKTIQIDEKYNYDEKYLKKKLNDDFIYLNIILQDEIIILYITWSFILHFNQSICSNKYVIDEGYLSPIKTLENMKDNSMGENLRRISYNSGRKIPFRIYSNDIFIKYHNEIIEKMIKICNKKCLDYDCVKFRFILKINENEIIENGYIIDIYTERLSIGYLTNILNKKNIKYNYLDFSYSMKYKYFVKEENLIGEIKIKFI